MGDGRNPDTVARAVTVVNAQGLHARPADLLVKLASQFQTKVEIVHGNQRADCKSILEIMSLGAFAGATLVLEAHGPDAAPAVEALARLFEQGFAEEG
ncbi:MAG: HPr family phosphocarrier protein [Pirellulales bacterium]|nr:HPr family phosphocarrier protein [Pirellulales bacterium]